MQIKRFRLVAGAAMVAAACAAMARDHDDGDAALAALVKARQKIFGVENVDEKGRVDKEKVIFSWATNTTYVASVLGRVILLDSYLSRPELPTSLIDRRYNPLLPKDLADAKPEAIFLGHGHGDHADNAAFIAKWSGATIYASAETCQVMQLDVQRMWNDPNAVNGGVKIIPDANPVKCVDVVPAGSRPGQYDETTGRSKATRLGALDPQICILAFKFIHSGTAPGIPGGAITILYQFTLRGDNHFSFAWLNSAGPATEGIGSDPGLVTLAQYNDPTTPPEKLALARTIGQSLYDLMDRLPATDVLLGSIVSLGAAANQQRDIIKVTQHLKPKVYYPGHITDVAGKGSGTSRKIAWRETALAMGFPQSEWPDFRLLLDPNDFLVPQVFDPKNDRWEERGKSARVPDQCR